MSEPPSGGSASEGEAPTLADPVDVAAEDLPAPAEGAAPAGAEQTTATPDELGGTGGEQAGGAG